MSVASVTVLFLLYCALCKAQDCPDLPCFGCVNPSSAITVTCAGGGLSSFPALPDDVQPRVDQLVLRGNDLTEITEFDLVNYTSLETLDISFNNLSSLEPDNFRTNTNLEELDLSGNRLSYIPEYLFANTSLIDLNLENNLFETVTAEMLFGLQDLSTLNLGGNSLETLPVNVFSSLGRFQNLILENNPLMCDCNLRWIFSFLSDSNVQPLSSMLGDCEVPTLNYTIAPLNSLSADDFGCPCEPECVNGECNETIRECLCTVGYNGTDCSTECPDGLFGDNCQGQCLCENGADCDIVSGYCSCTAGWMGLVCDEKCPEGTYGYGCLENCQCQNEADCSHIIGNCSCTAGYTGELCDQECLDGYYGEDCQFECECQNEASCDRITGDCNCTAGWTGLNCDEECEEGYFGPGCTQQCSCVQAVEECNRFNGSCVCKTNSTICDQPYTTQPTGTSNISTAETTDTSSVESTQPTGPANTPTTESTSGTVSPPMTTGAIIGTAAAVVIGTLVLILIAILITGLVWMYMKANKKRMQISPSYSSASQALIQPQNLEEGGSPEPQLPSNYSKSTHSLQNLEEEDPGQQLTSREENEHVPSAPPQMVCRDDPPPTYDEVIAKFSIEQGPSPTFFREGTGLTQSPDSTML